MAKTPLSAAPPVSDGSVRCPLFASPISAGLNNKWNPNSNDNAVRCQHLVQAQTANARRTSTGSGVLVSVGES
eukprot:1544299-Amphidinium_carterae.1